LVRSARGTRGGFMLARPAEGITTLEIIEAVEGPISLQRCLQAPGQCPQTGGCPLCGLFANAQSQVRSVFSQTALSDLLNRAATGPTGANDASRVSSSTHSPDLSLPL
jgi:Rrf2 family protein